MKSESGFLAFGSGIILIGILIISIGIYTYNSANATIRSAQRYEDEVLYENREKINSND